MTNLSVYRNSQKLVIELEYLQMTEISGNWDLNFPEINWNVYSDSPPQLMTCRSGLWT